MVTKFLASVLLLAIGAIGIKAFAQSRLSKEEKVQHITEKMAKELSLTEEQKPKVFQINLDRVNGQEESYKQGRKKEVIQNAVAKWETNLKQVLTDEQLKKLKL